MSTPRVELLMPNPLSEGPGIELPFVIGVLADLSGRGQAAKTEAVETQLKYEFRDVDRNRLDDLLCTLRPRLVLEVPYVLNQTDAIRVELAFECLADFRPDRVANRVPFLRALQGGSSQALATQLQWILHHPQFLALEATWLGLEHLVRSVIDVPQPQPARVHFRGADPTAFAGTAVPRVEIRVLDITKSELGGHLEEWRGHELFERSGLFDAICKHPFHAPSGRPFGLLVGDYDFDHGPEDVCSLVGLGMIAAAAHAPFVAGASARLFELETWRELREQNHLKERLHSPRHARWNALRRSEDSKYLCLALPRFLARAPYGEENPVEGLHLSEALGEDPAQALPWANAAFAFAANIARSFQRDGWFERIRGMEGGGRVDHMAVCLRRAPDGTQDLIGPAEVGFSTKGECALADLGLNVLSNILRTDSAAFLSAVSLHQTTPFADTGSDSSPGELQPLLCLCRFLHYLRCLARALVGTAASRADVERVLQSWIEQYVSIQPILRDRRRPLEGAHVTLREVPDQPGCHELLLDIRAVHQPLHDAGMQVSRFRARFRSR